MLAQTKALVAVVVVTTLEAVAAEFPLTVVQMNAQEAALKPGRSSSFIYLNRPAAIRREPKSASTRPLYGVMERGFAFRLDESNGTGTGYDRLLIDFNGNGDLGDDPAEGSAAKRRSRRADATRAAFGPIKPPPERIEGSWGGGFFADMTIYSLDRVASADRLSNTIIGVLSLNCDSYLTATVEVSGVKERVGLLDGNCNFRLGDRAKFKLNTAGKSEDWSVQPVDFVLRDRDGSGKFEHRLFRDEVELFCDPIYFGGNPFTLSFAPRTMALRVEPFGGPLGTLTMTSVAPVAALTLLRSNDAGQWEAITPEMSDGKARLPVGRYQLYSCQVAAKSSRRIWTAGVGYRSPAVETLVLEAEGSAPLKCGTPLSLRVQGTFIMSSSLRSFPGLGAGSGSKAVRVAAEVIGAGGEVYERFYQGKEMDRLKAIKPPRFEVVGERGWRIGGGKLDVREDQFYTQNWKVPSSYEGQRLTVKVEFDLGPLGPDGKPLKSEPVEVQYTGTKP